MSWLALLFKLMGLSLFGMSALGFAQAANRKDEKTLKRVSYAIASAACSQAALWLVIWLFQPWGRVVVLFPIALAGAALCMGCGYAGSLLIKRYPLIPMACFMAWERGLLHRIGDGVITALGAITALLAGGWLMRFDLHVPVKLALAMAIQIQVWRFLWGDKLQGRLLKVGKYYVDYHKQFVEPIAPALIALGVYAAVEFFKVELLTQALLQQVGLPVAIPNWAVWPSNIAEGLCGTAALALGLGIAYLPWLGLLLLYRLPAVHRVINWLLD